MDKKTIAIVLLLMLSSVYLSGCVNVAAAPKDDSQATDEGTQSVVDANNQFAIDLYKKISSGQKNGQENVFFSPYSLSEAMAICYEGANGQTAAEIEKVFHFPKDDIVRRSSYASLYNEINKEGRKYQLSTANALWAQKDYIFLSDYFNVINNYYDGKVTNLDFGVESEKSRQTINSWVEEKTNNKIKNLISPGMLDGNTKLVITNAIYFKGDWVYGFEKGKTKDEDFFVTPENTVKAKMMTMKVDKEKFNYTETEDLQMIEFPYKGEDLSMLIILPKENDISKLEESLTPKMIEDLRSKLSERKIPVFIPKFKFETKYQLNDPLSEMGMPTAFTPSTPQTTYADFSGMDGTNNLYIAFVVHQAYINVDESGTEAAAATGIGMSMASAGPTTEFRADHPFIFIIQQKETGNILFMGKVMDPTK